MDLQEIIQALNQHKNGRNVHVEMVKPLSGEVIQITSSTLRYGINPKNTQAYKERKAKEEELLNSNDPSLQEEKEKLIKKLESNRKRAETFAKNNEVLRPFTLFKNKETGKISIRFYVSSLPSKPHSCIFECNGIKVTREDCLNMGIVFKQSNIIDQFTIDIEKVIAITGK